MPPLEYKDGDDQQSKVSCAIKVFKYVYITLPVRNDKKKYNRGYRGEFNEFTSVRNLKLSVTKNDSERNSVCKNAF